MNNIQNQVQIIEVNLSLQEILKIITNILG